MPSPLQIRLYEQIGQLLVDLIKVNMLLPRPRFTNRPRMQKSLQYNTITPNGNLYRSVKYQINFTGDKPEIDILMADYGVNYVYGRGSFPGGGLYAKDTRPPEAKAQRSALITALTLWAERKMGLSNKSARSMAFAVRKNLFKYGYGGVELFTPAFQQQFFRRLEPLITQAPFNALPLIQEELIDLFDRINTFGEATYELTI